MLSFRIICLILIIAVPSCSRTPSKQPIEKMSATKLCAAATLSGEWETRSTYQSHVKTAKLRGLTCGVKTKPDPCPSELNSCNKDVICTGARTKPQNTNDKPYWANSPVFKRYAVEARSRGLSCANY